MSLELILAEAKRIAISQGRLPASPAEVDADGHVLLCAAACLAKAAIHVHDGGAESGDFESEIKHRNKDDYVPSLFDRYSIGLNATSVMNKNDRTPPSERLAWFVGLEAAALQQELC